MRLLTAAAILAAPDIKYEEVPTPEWAPSPLPEGTTADDFGVRVRTMTAEGRAQFIAQSMTAREAARASAEANGKGEAEQKTAADLSVECTLVQLTCVDDKGAPLFTKESLSDLMQKSGAPIGRIASVAQRLAGLTVQAQNATVKSSASTKT
jgi:hypothetical protein